MLIPRNSFVIALRALQKNKLQTVLTMSGMTIGVATVLTMIALEAEPKPRFRTRYAPPA